MASCGSLHSFRKHTSGTRIGFKRVADSGPVSESAAGKVFAELARHSLLEPIVAAAVPSSLVGYLLYLRGQGTVIPAWFLAFWLAVALAFYAVEVAIHLYHGALVATFVRSLGEHAKEAGVGGRTLVVVLDNDLVLIVDGTPFLPAGSKNIEFARFFSLDRVSLHPTVNSSLQWHRHYHGIAALSIREKVGETPSLRSRIEGIFEDWRTEPVSLAIYEKAIGTRTAPQGTI